MPFVCALNVTLPGRWERRLRKCGVTKAGGRRDQPEAAPGRRKSPREDELFQASWKKRSIIDPEEGDQHTGTFHPHEKCEQTP